LCRDKGGQSSRSWNVQAQEPAYLTGRKKLRRRSASGSNPAFDPEDAALFVTRSGSRGEELPVTLFRIDHQRRRF
jgi:hypothetical protein